MLDNYCTICARPGYVLGVFVPKDQVSVCAPAGKTRNVVYMLCKKCFADTDKAQRKIENMVSAEFSHTRN